MPQTSNMMNTVDFSENDIRRMSRSGTVEKDKPVRKILIGTPYIELIEGRAIQWCNISLGNIQKKVYFSVIENYADYLCHERGDAYLIGLLNLAMRERCDIHSEAPLTKELVHQLETELIPALTKYSNALYAPKITGDITSTPLPSENKIATGCSCGIDSLYAIKNLTEKRDGAFKPDILVINNVGAYSYMGETARNRYNDNVANAKKFSELYGAPLLVTDSNFADVFPQDHLRTHLYSSCFAIYMLRKLWSRYYYASTGCDLNTYFNLESNELHDAAAYDLIALPAFSIPQLRICNEGNYASRYAKTKALTEYELAWSFLNVCQNQGMGNCGFCSKCLRTLWTLDALDALLLFSKVFDIKTYRNSHSHFLRLLYISHRKKELMIDTPYAILNKKMGALQKIYAELTMRFQHYTLWEKMISLARKTKKTFYNH